MPKSKKTRTREECEEQGGTWDEENGTCDIPSEEEESKKRFIPTTTLEDLQTKERRLTHALRDMIDTARKEAEEGKRDSDALTPEERAQFDRLSTDLDKVADKIKDISESQSRVARFEAIEKQLRETSPTPAPRNYPGDVKPTSRSVYGTREYDIAFRKWLRTGDRTELRALSKDIDSEGGYTVASEEFLAELIKNVDDEVAVRRLARKFQTSASALGVPVLDSKLADATWGTELQVATADSTLDFGKKRLVPHPLSVRILVSKLLKLHAQVDVDGLVRSEFARSIGETEERAFLQGTGAGQPLGLFIGSPDGISTSRDMVTDSSSGNVTALNLINTYYSLKPAYRRNATWLFNRTRLRDVRKLQDSNNNFIWQPAGFGTAQGMTVAQGPTLLERPYIESEYAPNSTASTTGTAMNATGYTAIVGDFSAYWIADGPSLGVAMYDQINAATNQDTYIGLFQVDGKPAIEEAFARARLST